MSLLEINEVSKRFGPHEVLKGLNLNVEEHQVVCLIGPSGTGKSTLLRCINGLESIQGGSIEFDGQEIDRNRPDIVMARRKIGMIFQNFNLYPHLSALRNITMVP